eukprot:scaffold9972_cov24-Tisochrysis_lutea.AAC.1
MSSARVSRHRLPGSGLLSIAARKGPRQGCRRGSRSACCIHLCPKDDVLCSALALACVGTVEHGQEAHEAGLQEGQQVCVQRLQLCARLHSNTP